MIDCHSFFDVERAVAVATRLEPQRLAPYQEPVAPERADDTLAIERRITRPMSGGEVCSVSLDSLRSCRFTPWTYHAGREALRGAVRVDGIAAAADAEGVKVAPHNPSGPISLPAPVQVGAG